MRKDTRRKSPKRPKKGYGQPIRFDKAESVLIKTLQEKTDPVLSVSEIGRRAVRYAVPKFISGEVSLTNIPAKVPGR